MLENVTALLAQACALNPSQPVLVGVSGGPDSLCLLDILHKSGYPLVIACLDHGLRPESVAEVKMVQQIAIGRGLAFVTRRVDTPQFASRMNFSVEAAARHLRYEFLFAEAARCRAQAVAVAHTADDQAETVLMNLLRGAGLAGLKGMTFRTLIKSWSEAIPLVRPLLTTWRSELLEYCHHHGLTPALDASNQNPDYFRNRLRLEVLPYLEQIQPDLRQHLVRMAGILALDHELLQSRVQDAWQQCLLEQGFGYIAFHRPVILAQPLALQRYLLRQAMLYLRTAQQDIEFAMLERARDFLHGSSAHRTCDLGAGLQLRLEQETVWVVVRDVALPPGSWPAILNAQPLELPVSGSIDLSHGWVLQAVLGGIEKLASPPDLGSHDAYQATFDAACLTFPLHVRHRRPGDRLQPLGMNSKSVKLSDLMINLKLPYRSRATWPLICSGEHILWVPGCRQSELARPDESTRQVLQLRLLHLSPPGESD